MATITTGSRSQTKSTTIAPMIAKMMPMSLKLAVPSIARRRRPMRGSA